MPQRFIVIRIVFLVHIDRAHAAGCRVDAFGGGIEHQVVNSLSDWKRLEFFSGLAIENHNCSTAAAHKKTMDGFVERHRCVALAHFDRPTRGQFIRLAIDHLNFVFCRVIQVESVARLLQRHGFQRISVNLDIGKFCGRGGIDNAEHRKLFVRIVAAVVNVEIVRGWIVTDGIRIDFEWNSFQRIIGLSVVNVQDSLLFIRNINAAEIFTVQDRVRVVDLNGADKFPGG